MTWHISLLKLHVKRKTILTLNPVLILENKYSWTIYSYMYNFFLGIAGSRGACRKLVKGERVSRTGETECGRETEAKPATVWTREKGMVCLSNGLIQVCCSLSSNKAEHNKFFKRTTQGIGYMYMYIVIPSCYGTECSPVCTMYIDKQ